MRYILSIFIILTSSFILGQTKDSSQPYFYMSPDYEWIDSFASELNWKWKSKKDPDNRKISAQSLIIISAFEKKPDLINKYYNKCIQSESKKEIFEMLVLLSRAQKSSKMIDSLFIELKANPISKKHKKLIDDLNHTHWSDPIHDPIDNKFILIESKLLYEFTGNTKILKNIIKYLEQDNEFYVSVLKNLLKEFSKNDSKAFEYIKSELENKNHSSKVTNILTDVLKNKVHKIIYSP